MFVKYIGSCSVYQINIFRFTIICLEFFLFAFCKNISFVVFFKFTRKIQYEFISKIFNRSNQNDDIVLKSYDTKIGNLKKN